jgi:hypothetical protein
VRRSQRRVRHPSKIAFLSAASSRTLANWQAGGFNKPQRSGLIRTCPDWSTGSKPLVDLTLGGVSPLIEKWMLRGVLTGVLKRISRVVTASRVATANSRPSRIRPSSRLAYIEHEHRSHRFFQAIFTRPSYGDHEPKAAESLRPGPGIVPDRAHAVTRSFSPTHAARLSI